VCTQKLKGKELEDLILWRARQYDEPASRYSLGRYGVMASLIAGNWTPIQSLPDFEGVLPGGKQFIFDTKVCSQATYSLSGGTSKSFKNQYKHMRRRDKFGVMCFLLIHYNARELKTKSDPALTVLFPVGDTPFWEAYDNMEQKGITREDAVAYGTVMEWRLATDRGTKKSPDLIAALEQYMESE